MKLRTKVILFFGTFLFIISSGSVLYAEYFIGNIFKKQTVENFSIIAEQSEGAYLAFRSGMKGRALDWSSDVNIQRIAKAVISSPEGSNLRAREAEEFMSYVSKSKMSYDKTVFLVDLVDRNGRVVASTRSARIGKDEKKEKTSYDKATHDTESAFGLPFGEVLLSSIVFEEYENPRPFIHATSRLYQKGANDDFIPIEALLVLHFSNTTEIANALGVGDTSHTGRQTGNLLLDHYQTSDIYIVNGDRTMVTPSRVISDNTRRQKVDTFPVQECFDRGKETSSEYDNYQGARVLGASMCLQKDETVIIVEIAKSEIFAPVAKMVQGTALGGIGVFVFGAFVIISFVRRPLGRIADIVSALRQVMKGDFSVRAGVFGKDELAELATAFNTMTENIKQSQVKLKEANDKIQKEAFQLERDVEEHAKQEKFLEESKRAQLNLLEDAWQVKERLEVEGRRLQTILSSIGDALLLIDGAYRIALVNPVAEKMFGMSREELIGKDMRTFVTLWKKRTEVVPQAQWPIEEVFLTKKIIDATLDDDFAISTEKHPEKTPIVFSVAPISGGTTQGAVIVMRDATKDRELDDAKSGFISVASHQLRTPLTTIRWYAEMLLSGDVGDPTPSQRDFLNEIHGGAERLYQTIDLLLGISRVESGKMKTEKIEIDLGAYTEEIKKEFVPQTAEKNIAITVVPPTEDSPPVMLDRLMLRQVLLNLVSNALRYTKEEGYIELRWWRDASASEIVYAVRDSGIGIPESQRSRIFTKFFRAENALSMVPDGSGLGLALVKELVMSWGGRVWFETEEGEGTTFFFTIPLVTKVSLP